MIFHNIMHQLMVQNCFPKKSDQTSMFVNFYQNFTKVTEQDVDTFITSFYYFCTSIGSFENVVNEHLRPTSKPPPPPPYDDDYDDAVTKGAFKPTDKIQFATKNAATKQPLNNSSRRFVCEDCDNCYPSQRKMMNCDCQSKQLPVVTPSQHVRAKSRERSEVNYEEYLNNNEHDDESDGGDDVHDDDYTPPKDKRKRGQSISTSTTKEKKTKQDTLGKEKKKENKSKSRRKVNTNPKSPIQVKDETSERVMYSALQKFIKAQSISTPRSPRHRNIFPKVQPIAIIIDEMVQEPDKQSDSDFRREIPEVNFIAPNDMTKGNLGSLLVKYGRALQGLDEYGEVLQADAEAAIRVHFFNSGCEKSAVEVSNNLYGNKEKLKKKYGLK
jgi:hypothetical protein